MPLPPLPDGYPSKASAKELAETISALEAEASRWRSDEMLPELKLALLNAGLQEQSRRETASLNEVARNAAQSADRAASRTLKVAFATAGIALLTLVVALVQLATS